MRGQKRQWRAKTAENLKSWLIMLPGLILMTFFVWEPLFESIRMSLYKTRNVELVRFIGLDNFISVVSKDDFPSPTLSGRCCWALRCRCCWPC